MYVIRIFNVLFVLLIPQKRTIFLKIMERKSDELYSYMFDISINLDAFEIAKIPNKININLVLFVVVVF